MKYIIALMILVLPLAALSQNKWEPKNAKDTVIYNLIDSWNLGLSDAIKQPVDIRVFNKFKTLFDTAATIDDEFNAKYKLDSIDAKQKRGFYKYKLDSAKPFDVYAHDVALEVAVLKIDSFKVIDSDANVYEIYRKVTVQKKGQFVFENDSAYFKNEIKSREIEFDPKSDSALVYNKSRYNNMDSLYSFESNDTLIITLNDNLKIASIKRKNNKQVIKCVNDGDGDGVLSFEDSCKDKPGDFTAKGCPDTDFDGIPDEVDDCDNIYGPAWNNGCPPTYFTNKMSISGLFGLSNNICAVTLPEPDQFGYNDVDMNQSQKGSFRDPSPRLSSTFGADFSYYFGKKAKHWGLSIGISYIGFRATYNIEEPIITTFKANDGVNDYRRRVTITSDSKEDLNYHILNFPLLFKYRVKLGAKESTKWSMEVGAGPSVTYFNNSSDYNVNLDFEGLYQIDPATNSFHYFENFSDNPSDWNVLLTADDINNQSANPGVDSVFNQLNNLGYDFASNRNYTGTDKKATRFSVAFNLNLDFINKISSDLFLKFGAGFMISPALKNSSDYAPMDKTSDEYNSLYRSKVNSLFMSYGLHVGLVYNL